MVKKIDSTLELLGEAYQRLQAEQGIVWVRNNLRWSQAELCRFLGISKKSLAKMEMRETNGPAQNHHLFAILLLLTTSALRHAYVSEEALHSWAQQLRDRCSIYGPLAALHTVLEDNKALWRRFGG